MVDLFVSAYNDKNYDLIERQFSNQVEARVATQELRRFNDGLHTSSGKITSVGKPVFLELYDAVAIYPVDFERRKMELIMALEPNCVPNPITPSADNRKIFLSKT